MRTALRRGGPDPLRQRCHGADPGGSDARDEGRGQCDDESDRGDKLGILGRDRRSARRADQSGTRTGYQRSSQPAGEQADGCRDERQYHVLCQQHPRDTRRRGTSSLEQADPACLLCGPAADQHGHACER
jgi:hypothetical protein